ncbi:hypothetical protein HanPI659440_Chr05g0207891 [Helianthus annuus]|nr:hypothetical protein HanPI659440_Chr05g0207891 [Helianthus annuus]
MHDLTSGNEENHLIFIRIIFDLLNFRPTQETEVQPFLDFMCKIYQNFRLMVSHFLESGALVAPAMPPPSSMLALRSLGSEDVKANGDFRSSWVFHCRSSTASSTRAGQLNPSTRSFKIVTASPLVVMFLFQLYNQLVQTNIPPTIAIDGCYY